MNAPQSKVDILSSEDFARISGLKVDEMVTLRMRGNQFSARNEMAGNYLINHHASKAGIVVRIQKYLDKFYVIRVA